MKIFNLIDYKGKHTVIQDVDIEDEYGMEYIVGTITKEQAFREAPERLELSQYYGVPAYVGHDEDMIKIYN